MTRLKELYIRTTNKLIKESFPFHSSRHRILYTCIKFLREVYLTLSYSVRMRTRPSPVFQMLKNP